MKSIEERFWSKVEKTDTCWNWTGAKFNHGYGQFMERKLAHRVAWELANGPIPDGLCVLHRCDQPLCVRTDHLFLGTRADNNRDRSRKGRTARQTGERHWSRRYPERVSRGEQHVSAKLDEARVRAIRVLAADGYTKAALSRHFSISESAVHFVVNHHTWDHVK